MMAIARGITLQHGPSHRVHMFGRGVEHYARVANLPLFVAYAVLEAEARARILALPPGPPVQHGEYGEPWCHGSSCGAIVTAAPISSDTMANRGEADFYGGEFIGESISDPFRQRIIDCVNFCRDVSIPHGVALTEVLRALDNSTQLFLRGENVPDATDKAEHALKVSRLFAGRQRQDKEGACD